MSPSRGFTIGLSTALVLGLGGLRPVAGVQVPRQPPDWEVSSAGARSGTPSSTLASPNGCLALQGRFPAEPFGPSWSVAVRGSYAYYGRGAVFVVEDLSDPMNPTTAGEVLLPGFIQQGIVIVGDLAYVTNEDAGLRILDISNPATPVEIGAYVPPDFGNGIGVAGVAVAGSYAYIADFFNGIWIVDISDPVAPVAVGFFPTPDTGPLGIDAAGSYAYVADANAGLRVLDVSVPSEPAQIGFLDTVNSLTPGVPEHPQVVGSLVYLADGPAGLRVIDVSNPAAPQEIGLYDTAGYAEWVTVVGSIAYVPDGPDGLLILDVSNPATPSLAGGLDTPGYAIDVALSGSIACLADHSGGLRILDVNPENPVELSSRESFGFFLGAAISGDLAYVLSDGIDGADAGFRVLDVSDPASPVEIGRASTPGSGPGIAVSGNHGYVADGTAGLRIFDLSNPANPAEVGSIPTPLPNFDGQFRAVVVSGSYAYVAAETIGLRIIDVSDPAAPFDAGSYDTLGRSRDIALSGQYAYLAAGGQGLRIIDVSTPLEPFEVGSIPTPAPARGVAVAGGLAYVAASEAGLRVIDVSDPAAPTEVGSLFTGGLAARVALSGSLAVLADGNALRVIDISVPSDPVEVQAIETPGNARGVALSGSLAFVSDSFAGLEVIDLAPCAGADLAITIADSPDPVGADSTLTYTISISNLGPSAATSVEVVDFLSPDVTFLDVSGSGWTCDFVEGPITCTRPSLAVGTAPPITITVLGPAASGTIANLAGVTAIEDDPDPANNAAVEFTTVIEGLISWNNPAGGSWSNPANWTPSQVPGSANQAYITLDGTYTVTLDVDASVGGLTVGGSNGTQTFADTSRTLTLNGPSAFGVHGILDLAGGTLTGSGDLTLDGAFKWSGGTMSGTGVTNANGGLTLSGTGGKALGRVLNNPGLATYSGTGALQLFSPGTFNNLPTGTFDAQGDTPLIPFNGGEPFNNQGMFKKTAGTGALDVSLTFTNTGSVDVQVGTLRLLSGATHTGTFDCTGATISFAGGIHNLSASNTLTGTNVTFSGGTVNLPGGYDITGTTSVSGGIANFTGTLAGIGTIQLTGGTLNLSNVEGTVSQASFTQPGGTLTGSSDFTVSGNFTWTSGTQSGTGVTNANGGLTLSGTGGKALGRVLNNPGLATYSGTGALQLFSPGTFNNLPTGTFDAQGDTPLIPFNGGEPFNNQGTFRKSAGTGTMNVSLTFTNTGSVDVQVGTLRLLSGATHTGTFDCTGATISFAGGIHNLSASNTLTGTDVTFSGGTVNLPGGYDITGTTSVSGGIANFTGTLAGIGTIQLTGGTLNLSNVEGTVSQASFTQPGGTLTGSSDFTVSGNFTWTSGTQSGTGVTNANGGLTLSGTGGKALGRVLNNPGLATYSGTGALQLFSPGTFNNLPTGTFDAQGDTPLIPFNGGEPFNNQGMFRKSAGTGTMNVSLTFTNTGAVEALSGTLNFLGGFMQTAGSTSLNGGALTSTTTINIQGGSLVGFGTVTGNVSNSGALSPGFSPNVLNIAGNYTQAAAGTFDVEIGGATAGTDYDQVNITGPGGASLDGALNVSLIYEFTPGLGDTFTIMTFASRTGVFATQNLPPLPNGLSWNLNYGAGSVALAVVAACPEGTPCDDGNSCTTNDLCSSGVCAGTAVVCQPLDQCHLAGMCDVEAGACSNPTKPNGSACSEANACTQIDTCQAGQCVGSNPVVCQPLDQCHLAGTCDVETGACSNPTKPNGSACSDINACTQTDTCQTGQCVGSNPVICQPLDQCHLAGTCDVETGACSNPTKPNGSACSDINACTQTDTCQTGQCVGSNPVICQPLDQCHLAGTCDVETGVCSDTALPDGTVCRDGNAATTEDRCRSSVCLGGLGDRRLAVSVRSKRGRNGMPIGNVTLRLVGPEGVITGKTKASNSPKTDPLCGKYEFTRLGQETYTVTPTRAGCRFTPATALIGTQNGNATTAFVGICR